MLRLCRVEHRDCVAIGDPYDAAGKFCRRGMRGAEQEGKD